MTNVEMVKWAELDELLADDERIKKLIWIAQLEGRMQILKELGKDAPRHLIDAGGLSSYPGGFLKRQKND